MLYWRLRKSPARKSPASSNPTRSTIQSVSFGTYGRIASFEKNPASNRPTSWKRACNAHAGEFVELMDKAYAETAIAPSLRRLTPWPSGKLM